jgi:predicted DNA binding CopG/RHH family protein
MGKAKQSRVSANRHFKNDYFCILFQIIFSTFKSNFNMEATDFLSMKTTNINLRVSPLLKMQIMERGAKMSANLSDYIGFVLTKEMTGANAPPDPKESAEYRELAQLLRGARLELQKYETALAPFAKQWVGKEVQIDGKTQKCNTPHDALNFLVNSFKIRV